MCKRWTGGALLAVWLGLAVSAHAQYLPLLSSAPQKPDKLPGESEGMGSTPSSSPAGAPSSEPADTRSPSSGNTPSATDPLAPPVGPLALPAVPPGGPDAAAGPTGAFPCDGGPGKGCHCYAYAGAMALQRGRLNGGDVAVLDPNPGGALPSGIQTGPGNVPLGQPTVQNFRDLLPPMAWGFRGTAGVLWDNCHALELTGWFISPSGSTDISRYPHQIDTLFYNQPVGFASNLKSDNLTTFQNTRLFNVEANCRKWCCFAGLELIAGLRYLQVRDALNIETVGTVTNSMFSASDYQVTASSHLVTGQVGAEYNLWLLNWLSVGINGKAGLGPSFINSYVSLTRPDGYIGFNSPHHNVSFGQIYELGGYVDFHIWSCFRVRAGYITLWLENVANSVDQVDFNLRGNTPPGYNFQQAGDYTRLQPHGLNNNFGNLFFQGPMFECQLLF